MFQSACRRLLLQTPGRSATFLRVASSAVHRPNVPRTIGSTRFFSEAPKEEAKEVDPMAAVAAAQAEKLLAVKKQLWEIYLSTGRGANALFEAIDLDENGAVDPEDLKSFMIEVMGDEDPKEIMPYAWNRLEQRAAAGVQYDLRHFKKWLVAATKMSADMKNSRVMAYLMQNPEVGERFFNQLPHQGLHAFDDEEPANYTWNEETMSQSLRRMQYAVRGEVAMLADKLAAEGREILYTNIGNPHQVGQSPITYYRQVLALCDLPAECGVDHPKAHEMFPADVIARANEYRDIIGPSGTGAYTHSQGILGLRKHVAKFIEARDGYPSYPGDIFLTNGASAGIAMVLQGLMANNNDAVMIPIPQYPIYSALIAKLGGRQIGYNMDESLNWAVTREELDSKLAKAKKEGLEVKALAMINPGNPSGNLMTHCDIQTVAEFCAEHGIVLLADEVYQANVYGDSAQFVSAKKVALDARLRDLQLLYKLASSELCSGVVGQIMTSLMVKPPLPEDESYELFRKETTTIFEGMKERSRKLVEGLNKIEGISCVPAEAAMYAFPSIQVPPKAVERAKEMGTTPDNLYALSLLQETGICVVPASGFGQAKGRVGFRTTFLHPDTVKAVDLFAKHHEKFVKEYS
ncbi:Probable alanine aminotransferase, mitochondrial [Seminavis robusta]|uniref:Alanine aminotransferase 1 n=1 Tax=Seminavis robusta TaxID=568900 RepID=A0A9N8EXT9_9STRA|nr:Probable alanine aminotransferase, mitochondrial [Seminavis robusta]|eukprot:Sro2024_g311620.1 Probable alanine aminotransferase, mitochondrial (633) ;mRNA; r:16181-18401